MSDQRRMVPSETPRASAACEVESPSGLLRVLFMDLLHLESPTLPKVVEHLHKLV